MIVKKLMILAIAAGLATTGCRKTAKQLTNINVDIPYSHEFNIPETPGYTYGVPLPPGGISVPIPAVPVPTHSQQFIQELGTTTDKLVSVDLKRLHLTIPSPPGRNFDFADSVEVYISAKGQPEMLIAYQYNIPKQEDTLEFTTNTQVNLKNYFLQDTMYFRLRARINSIPPPSEKVRITTVFHLLANPLE